MNQLKQRKGLLVPTTFLVALALAVVFGAVALMNNAAPAEAHTSPGGCTATGVNISLTAFRADGVTPVLTSGDGTVQSGETVNYQTTLSFAGAPNCNFEGGALRVSYEIAVPRPFMAFCL